MSSKEKGHGSSKTKASPYGDHKKVEGKGHKRQSTKVDDGLLTSNKKDSADGERRDKSGKREKHRENDGSREQTLLSKEKRHESDTKLSREERHRRSSKDVHDHPKVADGKSRRHKETEFDTSKQRHDEDEQELRKLRHEEKKRIKLAAIENEESKTKESRKRGGDDDKYRETEKEQRRRKRDENIADNESRNRDNGAKGDDRPKERREKRENDLDKVRDKEEDRRRQKDENYSKKSSEHKRQRDKSDKKVTKDGNEMLEISKPTKEGDICYDDDFEDYDEDFEEDAAETEEDASEVIKSGKNSSDSQRSSRASDVPLQPKPTEVRIQEKTVNKTVQNSFINFRFAQKKYCTDATANRMLSRAYDLASFIELERVSYDVCELAPVTEHDKLYARLGGGSGAQHVSSQTRDDCVGRDMQTEPVNLRHVWSQHPATCDSGDSGYGRSGDDGFGVEGGSGDYEPTSAGTEDKDRTVLELVSGGSGGGSGLTELAELMCGVLEEDEASQSPLTSTVAASLRALSQGCNQFDLGLANKLLLARLGPHCDMFAGVYVSQETPVTSVLVWKIGRPGSEPHCMLGLSAGAGKVTCMTFSPGTAGRHVLVGLDSGSLLLYDLEDEGTETARDPAYAASTQTHEHGHPLVCLHTLTTSGSAGYRLLSIDSAGLLLTWSVTTSHQLATSTDLQARPDSSLTLHRLSSLPLLPPEAATHIVTASCPSSIGDDLLYLGSAAGLIYRVSRAASNRRQHRPLLYGAVRHPFERASVTQLDLCPFNEPFFLAGYSDGQMRIFLETNPDHCLVELSNSEQPILRCLWSRNQPALIYSLDAQSMLCVWQLTDTDSDDDTDSAGFSSQVVGSPKLLLSSQQAKGCIGMDLGPGADHRRLLLWALDGKAEVHQLQSRLTNVQSHDVYRTVTSLQALI